VPLECDSNLTVVIHFSINLTPNLTLIPTLTYTLIDFVTQPRSQGSPRVKESDPQPADPEPASSTGLKESDPQLAGPEPASSAVVEESDPKEPGPDPQLVSPEGVKESVPQELAGLQRGTEADGIRIILDSLEVKDEGKKEEIEEEGLFGV
jgi:hypothetical protein